MDKWEGVVAVVTGASAGIGRAVAITLAEHGMKVAALARRAERLEELSSGFSGKGEIVGIQCDMANPIMIDEVFLRIASEMGPIRVLINNAGIGIGSKFADFEIDLWRKTFEVNVFGLFECTKRVIKAYKESGSQDLCHIINVNSIAGFTEFETHVDIYPYSASKHCLRLLTKALMKQMVIDKANIRITSIHPGVVKTEFFDAGNFFKDDFGNLPGLQSEDLALACVNILSADPNVLISSLAMKPMGEIF